MENNLRSCKNCNETKAYILDKRYDYKNKRYVDENNRQWNGKCCPDCHAMKSKIYMKSKRTSVKVV